MRGRVRGSLAGNGIVCLLALMMMAPAVALAPSAELSPRDAQAQEDLATLSGPASSAAEADGLAWMDTLPIDRLEVVAQQRAEAARPFVFPIPDGLPGYADLAEDEQRLAWKEWTRATALAEQEPGLPFDRAPAAKEVSNETESDFGKPRALQALWSLESHGQPRDMHLADDDGGAFVVTDRGVMKFSAGRATPDWMVKPGGYLGRTATADANGDGALDLVVGLYNFYGEDQPTIVVVDGLTGAVLFTGLSGEEQLYTWTLTDTDGDGTQDLLGVDAQARLVSYGLDGTLHYAKEIPDLPTPPSVSLPLVYARLYYDRYASGGFADVDGDGVQDIVITNGYDLYAFAAVVSSRATVDLLSAYSGTDGSLLWQAPLEPPGAGWSYTYPVATGDLDGDGMEDLLFRSFRFTFTVGALLVESHSRVHSGLGGTVLTDDSYSYVCVVLICTPPLPSTPSFVPSALSDLDGDGADELVGLGSEYDWETSEVRIWFEGRTASAVPGGPSETAYAHELVQGTYGEADVSQVRLRDIDGDGSPEALVAVFTAQVDEEGALESMAIHHYVVDEKGATGGPMPDLYGFWDYDATGTAYAWSVRDDRWGPIGDDGKRTTDGFRLIVSMAPLAFFDHTADKVPDMLLRKTLGYMWVDGKTGALLDDVIRPIEVRTYGVYEERGRLFILEYHFTQDAFALIDIETLTEAWRLEQDLLSGNWIDALIDVTGDGRLDVVTEQYEFSYSEDSTTPLGGPDSFRVSDQRTIEIRDMAAGEVVWEREITDGYVRFGDAVVQRPGAEILLHQRDDETRSRMIALHVPGEEEARWSYNLGTDGRFLRDSGGFLLMRNEQEGEVFEVVSGDNGELVSSVPLPADTSSRQVFFTKMNGDKFPDLVVSYVEEEGDEDYSVQVLVQDWAAEKEIARYTLVGNGEERYNRIESGIYLHVPEVGFASAEVGDWDRDGLVDLAYREADRALVRSTANGEILALAPGAGTIMFAPDLNDDGRNEIGMVTDRGRLRFFAYQPSIGELAEEDESSVRTVTQVNGTETESGAEKFFERSEENGLPAPGFGLAVLLLALVAFVVRRRHA